jgi:hypothetical protein
MNNEPVDALDCLNRVSIDAGDMETVLVEMRRMPADDCSFEAVVDLIRKLSPKKSADYPLAMALRLHALAVALEDPIPGLVRASGEGAPLIARWAIAAACRCDLVPLDEQPAAFDPTQFRVAAMNAVVPAGTA